MPRSFSWAILTNETWQNASSISEARTLRTWERLLLDAESLLPEIGPAIVLAAAALETLIAYTLDHLATLRGLDRDLWAWVTNRPDPRSDPSVEEQFDVLLKVVSGKSLKADLTLWNHFKSLKNARNKFVHEGVPKIGSEQVDLTRATQLIVGAKLVADWIEQLLPEPLRRPQLRPVTTTTTYMLT